MKVFALFSLILAIVWGSPIEQKDDVLFPSRRIVGGIEATPHAYPYQVGMLIIKPGKVMTWCGGSIISNQFIVTAAHCIYEADGARLYLGAHDKIDIEEEGQQRITVTKFEFIIHPKWDHELVVNDIALIKLDEPIVFTDYIQPINLPKVSTLESDFEDKIATASGWGQTVDGDPTTPDFLQHVEVKVISQEKCESFYVFTTRPGNICTSGAGGKNTCNGDSGGPLAIKEEDGSTTLIGLTSFGWKRGCELGYPGVFTRISYYIDWISKETGIEKRN